MLTLHYLDNSRSQRILWLLTELGVDYQLQIHLRDPKTNLAPSSLKAIHPLGKSPVLTDGDKVIAESAMIIDYLIKQYGQETMPVITDPEQQEQIQYWLHYGEGSLMPFLVMSLIFDKIKTAPMPFFIRPIAKAIANQVLSSYISPNVSAHLAMIEQHLQGKTWFVGESLSGADIIMSFPLEALMKKPDIAQAHPNIKQYVERIHARSGYQQALKAGADYAYA
ncbi:MAG: glutathione S-transferase [Bacterioplanes sp.]|nr:glutathione S-transferase [Bacterioplanes sp.]